MWFRLLKEEAWTNTEVEVQKCLNLLRHRVDKPDSARKDLAPVSLACKGTDKKKADCHSSSAHKQVIILVLLEQTQGRGLNDIAARMLLPMKDADAG